MDFEEISKYSGEIPNDIKLEMIKNIFSPLMTNLGEKLGLMFKLDSLDKCFQLHWGFSFIKPEWKVFEINFEFGCIDLQNLYFGFRTDVPQDLVQCLYDLNYKHTPHWPLFQFMDHYSNWNKEFFLELHSNENNIANVFESNINEILLLVEDMNYEL
jgi:hypothetical protein